VLRLAQRFRSASQQTHFLAHPLYCLTPLESALIDVYGNKPLYLPLESTLTPKKGVPRLPALRDSDFQEGLGLIIENSSALIPGR